MLGFDLTAVASLQRFQMQFEDLDKIGAGGFSTVNKVRNKRDRKIYALKTVKIKPSQWKGSVSQHIERVLTQGKILSTLKHPNVLRYHCCWISADLCTQQELAADTQQSAEQQTQLQLIIDELSSNSYGFQFQRRSQSLEKKKNVSKNIRNQKYHDAENDNLFGVNLLKFKQIRIHFLSQLGQYSLQKHISLRNSQTRKTYLQKRQIKIQNYKIILDIIEGLMYIHNQKIIHRDIKLQNIILNNHKQCKIIDFGLAKRVKKGSLLNAQNCLFQIDLESQSGQQRHSSSVGTRIFSSPQQRDSQYYDYRTDIYSLGMVIGVIFSQYQTQHQQKQVLHQLRSRNLDTFDIDQRLKVILYKCLGQQKSRPELKQIKTIIKTLLKEQLQKENQNEYKVFQKISYKNTDSQNYRAKNARKILIQKDLKNIIPNEEKRELK